jgi:hypothetical protein
VTLEEQAWSSCNGDYPCVVPLDARDDALLLCHNNTDDIVCAIWVPTDQFKVGGEPLLVASLVVVGCAWAMAMGVVWWMVVRSLRSNWRAVVTLLFVGVMALVCVSLVASSEIHSYAARTQVDKEYISYHGCLRHCIQKGRYDGAIRYTNQCMDGGTNNSCSTSANVEDLVEFEYCKSCQAHRDAFPFLGYAATAMLCKMWYYPPLFLFLLFACRSQALFGVGLVAVVADACVTLVMWGLISPGGQREVMAYATTMAGAGDGLFGVYTAWSVAAIAVLAFGIVAAVAKLSKSAEQPARQVRAHMPRIDLNARGFRASAAGPAGGSCCADAIRTAACGSP